MAALPPPDVAMDMSSPAHRMDEDHDIEIEVEDYPLLDYADDERMILDGDQVRLDTVDENMDEDAQVNVVHEETMQDEPLPDIGAALVDEDDELIDYDDEEQFYEEHHPLTRNNNLNPDNQSSFATTENLGDELPSAEQGDGSGSAVADLNINANAAEHDPDALIVQGTAAELAIGISEQPLDLSNNVGSSVPEEVKPASAALNSISEAEHDVAAAHHQDEHELDNNTEQNETVDAQAAYEGDEIVGEQSHAVNTPQHAQEAPLSPTDTGLHPVILCYTSKDFELPLFKSRTAPDGLLDDDNLASVSLSELMRNCREVFVQDLGMTVEDGQEIYFAFVHMKSRVFESDHAAFEFSLKDVLDNFVQLHKIDHVQDIPAMQLAIGVDYQFKRLFETMKRATQEGHGLSRFDYVNWEEEYDWNATDNVDHTLANEEEHEYAGQGTEVTDGARNAEGTVGEESREDNDVKAHADPDGGDEQADENAHHESAGQHSSDAKQSLGPATSQPQNNHIGASETDAFDQDPSDTSSATLNNTSAIGTAHHITDSNNQVTVAGDQEETNSANYTLPSFTDLHNTDSTLVGSDGVRRDEQKNQGEYGWNLDEDDDLIGYDTDHYEGSLAKDTTISHLGTFGEQDDSAHDDKERPSNLSSHELSDKYTHDEKSGLDGDEDFLDELVEDDAGVNEDTTFHSTYEFNQDDLDGDDHAQGVDEYSENHTDNTALPALEEDEHADEDDGGLFDFDDLAEEDSYVEINHVSQHSHESGGDEGNPAINGHTLAEYNQNQDGVTHTDPASTDLIDFFDDDNDDGSLRVPAPDPATKSPNAKRRLEDSADDYIDFSEDDEPEPKKVRATI